jgi:hypothetical protein
MVAILPIILGAIASLLSWLGLNVAQSWVESGLKLNVKVELSPGERVKVFKMLGVKVSFEGMLQITTVGKFGPGGVYEETPWGPVLTPTGGELEVNVPGTMTGFKVPVDVNSRSASGSLKMIFPAGRFSLNVALNNLTFLAPWGGTIKRDWSQTISIDVENPTAEIKYSFEPSQPRAKENVKLRGAITLDGVPPLSYASEAAATEVHVRYEGHDIRAAVDPATGQFACDLVFPEPKSYTLAIEASAGGGYAYIGVWTTVGPTINVMGEIPVAAGTIVLSSVTPQAPQAGESVVVEVTYLPFKEMYLKLDGTTQARISTDASGVGKGTIAGADIKPGEHVIQVQSVEDPSVIAERSIVVAAKPQVKINCTAEDVSLPSGGVYYFMVDTTQDGSFVPHRVLWKLADISQDEYTCETGMSAVKLVFPTGKYRYRMILSLLIYVYVDSESRRFSAKVTLG